MRSYYRSEVTVCRIPRLSFKSILDLITVEGLALWLGTKIVSKQFKEI